MSHLSLFLAKRDKDFRLSLGNLQNLDEVDPGVSFLDEDNFPAGEDILRAIPSKSELVDLRLLLLNMTECLERDCLSMGRSPRES